MTDQRERDPHARPAKVAHSALIIVALLAILSLAFTITLLGSFAKR